MSRAPFFIWIAYLIAPISAAVSAADTRLTTDAGCFHANNKSGQPESQACPADAGDPLDLAHHSSILQVIDAYQLNKTRIVIVGCHNTDFFTSMDGGATVSSRVYRIYYRISPDIQLHDYIAPVAHELGHVFQMEQAGGNAQLRADYEIKRIELGADFLAGVVLGRLSSSDLMDLFQHNVQLVGKYIEASQDAHGTPEQRTKAFRFGYQYSDKPTLARSHQLFQDNEYGRVVGF